VLKVHVDGPTNADLEARLDEILNAIQETRLTATPAPASEERPLGEPEEAVRGFGRMVEKFR
jgi:hypothetical protein